MSLFQAAVLGVLRGLTEFLPLSSFGHGVLVRTLFGMKGCLCVFECAFHGGTLLAVLIYFFQDVRDVAVDFWESLAKIKPGKAGMPAGVQPPHKGLWACILITLIPTVPVVLFLKHPFWKVASDPTFVACAWLTMGIVLLLSERFQNGQKDLAFIHYGDAFWMGLVQGAALISGISRSGSTILAGMGLGLRKETAAKFSFLMFIPAVAGSLYFDLRHGVAFFTASFAPLLTGFVFSAVAGFLALRWLMGLVQRGRFFLFGYYCIAASLFTFTFMFLSK